MQNSRFMEVCQFRHVVNPSRRRLRVFRIYTRNWRNNLKSKSIIIISISSKIDSLNKPSEIDFSQTKTSKNSRMESNAPMKCRECSSSPPQRILGEESQISREIKFWNLFLIYETGEAPSSVKDSGRSKWLNYPSLAICLNMAYLWIWCNFFSQKTNNNIKTKLKSLKLKNKA